MAKRLANVGDGGAIVIADGVTVLPFPPVAWGLVENWGGTDRGVGVVPEFDAHIRAADAVDVTGLVIYAGRSFLTDVGDKTADDGDLNVATNAVAIAAHGYQTGDGPVAAVPDVGDVLPSGLEEGEEYWLIKVNDNSVKFAATLLDATEGTAIDLDYATRAELDLSALAANNIDLVVEAILPGVGGESITLDIVFDAAGAPTLSEVGNAVTLHAKNNVTTNGDLADVLNTSTKLRVKTDTATPLYVLQSATDNFAATALAVVTGTQGFTVTSGDDTRRFFWTELEDGGDFSLDVNLAKTLPGIPHRGAVVAYCAAGTLSDTVAVTIQLDPVVELDG